MKIYEVERISGGKRGKIVVRAENPAQAREEASKKHVGTIIRTKQLNSMPISAQLSEFKEKIGGSIFKPKVKIPNLVATVRQLHVMTDAGISIHDSIKEVVKATEDKRLKEIFSRVNDDLNAGMSLTESLENFKSELGAVFIAMVKLGEESGNIADALQKLAEIMQDVWDNQKKFKKAIRYPVIVVIAIAIAFTILMLVVVPQFRQIFAELHANLPLPTVILLGIESAMSNYGLYILAAMIAAFFVIKHFYRTNPAFKDKFDTKILRVYLIGNIIFFSTMHRFNLIFGELVRSGVPVVEAINTSAITVANTFIRKKFDGVKTSVQRGNSLNAAVDDTGLYEGMLVQMISAGEKSGSLDNMIGKVTDYYKERFDNIVDNISSYVEPILLVFIAGMVLLMALGIFLPMWELGNAVRS